MNIMFSYAEKIVHKTFIKNHLSNMTFQKGLAEFEFIAFLMVETHTTSIDFY